MLQNNTIIKGAIFDLDGTVGDSVSVGLEAFRRTFLKYTGKLFTDEEILATWGPSEEGILMDMFPSQWQDALDEYLRNYDQIHDEKGVVAFEGFSEVIALLDQYNVHKAIVTAKGKHSAEISLKHYQLENQFECVEHGSPDRHLKAEQIASVVERWGVAKEHVIYVGDFPSDIAASRQAGVVAVSAAWAPTANAEMLAHHQPDYLFKTIGQFRDWLVASLDGQG
jgi:phosphoglycolate phosphatase-like HAD superfamily hydrolase